MVEEESMRLKELRDIFNSIDEDRAGGKVYAKKWLSVKGLQEETLEFFRDLKNFLYTSTYLQDESKIYLQNEVSYGDVAKIVGGKNSCVTAKITRDAKKLNSLFGENFVLRLIDYKDNPKYYIETLRQLENRNSVSARFKSSSLLSLSKYNARKQPVTKKDLQVALGLLRTYRKENVKTANATINPDAVEYILYLLDGLRLTEDEIRLRDTIIKMLEI